MYTWVCVSWFGVYNVLHMCRRTSYIYIYYCIIWTCTHTHMTKVYKYTLGHVHNKYTHLITFIYFDIYIYTHVCVCVYTYKYRYRHACSFTVVYRYTRTHRYTHIHIYTYKHQYTHIYTQTSIHIINAYMHKCIHA